MNRLIIKTNKVDVKSSNNVDSFASLTESNLSSFKTLLPNNKLKDRWNTIGIIIDLNLKYKNANNDPKEADSRTWLVTGKKIISSLDLNSDI